MVVHDLCGIEDVLNGVLGLRLFDDGGSRDTLAARQFRHYVRFNVLVVGGGSGHDDVGRDTGFILPDTFQHSFALLGRGSAIRFGGAAEHDQSVEMSCGSVMRWNSEIDADEEEDVGEGDCQNQKENSVE